MGLNRCVRISKRIWNTFPSIHDNTRTGVNLHTSFTFTLSRPKSLEVRIGYRETVTNVEMIVPIVTAPIKLCKIR